MRAWLANQVTEYMVSADTNADTNEMYSHACHVQMATKRIRFGGSVSSAFSTRC